MVKTHLETKIDRLLEHAKTDVAERELNKSDDNPRLVWQNKNQLQDNVLNIKQIDWKVLENSVSHHTDRFELTHTPPIHLVLRRGQTFEFTVQFDRKFDPDHHRVWLELSFGSESTPETRLRRVVVAKLKSSHSKPELCGWYADLTMIPGTDGLSDGKLFMVEVKIPPSVEVGEWNLEIRTLVTEERRAHIAYKHAGYVFILFNPWCENDAVYIEKDEDLKKYLMNTKTSWFGNNNSVKWDLAQFEDVVLYTALCGLHLVSSLKQSDRGDPVKVVRALTNLIGTKVIFGMWYGSVEGGTAPWKWNGSLTILRKFLNGDCKQKVKFAQCWVFAAVAVSICRALGIPSRAVTNITSAKDKDGSLTITKKYYKNNGRYISSEANEDNWSFHVWTEVFLKRDDLPAGYDGWQAIDPTCEDPNNTTWQCGPAPVAAIHRAEMKLNYDVGYFFSCVNADQFVSYYKSKFDAENGLNPDRPVTQDTTIFGKAVLTADEDSPEGLYITDTYKPAEGTKAERLQVEKAILMGTAEASRQETLKLYKFDTNKVLLSDVRVVLDRMERVDVGEPVYVRLLCSNTNKTESREVNVQLEVSIVPDCLPHGRQVMFEKRLVTVAPGKTEHVKLVITPQVYAAQLQGDSALKVQFVADVEQTRQITSGCEICQINKIGLVVKAKDTLELNVPQEVLVYFANMTGLELSSATLTVEGTHLLAHGGSDNKTFPVTIKDLTQGYPVKVTPTRKGELTLHVHLNSKLLKHFVAHKTVVVE